ncbi:cellulase family glycosylhydrolase [Tessaracoccus lapidicaptus]|uniref:cellulase family glycosylhydrolase n=1 Tax=Tessaracoccus lapidicaptus TaxID=1427523 RepID=UPI00333F91D1
MQRRRSPMARWLALAVAVVLGVGLGPSAQAAPPPDGDRVPTALSAERIVADMQPGWNLGNTLDAVGADETAWGNPRVTPELLRAVRAEGFRSIRIPVTWGQHDGGAPDHTIDPAVLDRVAEVVDLALDADLTVLLNLHHDSWMWLNQYPTQPEAKDRFLALWRQIAHRFRDYPRTLLLESINEPQFAGVDDARAYELLNDLNTAFVDEVRASGGGNAQRVLVLPTLHTDAGQARLDALVETLDELDDDNIAATFHYYGYWPFSVNVAGGYRFDDTARADMLGAFDRVKTSLVDRGVPVILGEYGLLGFDRHTGTIEQGEKLRFFELFGWLARTHDVTTMWWDNGQHLDRVAHTWRDPQLADHIATSWTTRSGTATTDQLFVRPGSPADQTVTLEPHGHAFTGVWLDGRRLKRSDDYTLDGDQLTLHGSLLAALAGSGDYGVRAALEVRFSRGVPWTVQVIRADAPVLSAAVTADPADGFAIPTRFNGDRLATMESVYPDGAFAGPHNWTSYKEFDAAFAPDEAGDRILLRPAFLAELAQPSTVLLTFHFWSGERVAYTLEVGEGGVVGTPGHPAA